MKTTFSVLISISAIKENRMGSGPGSIEAGGKQSSDEEQSNECVFNFSSWSLSSLMRMSSVEVDGYLQLTGDHF